MKTTSGLSRVASRQWLERIDDALRSNNPESAGTLALDALSAGVEEPRVLNMAAAVRFAEGKLEEAAQLLRRARRLAPKDAQILNGLGVCLQAVGKLDEALEAYNAAVRSDPGVAAAHFNRGTVLEDLNDLNGARAAFARAADLDPTYVHPIASLAWRDAQAGDAVAARENGRRALRLSAINALARMALASADLHEGNVGEAAQRLTELAQDRSLTPLNRSIVLGLIGDLHDAHESSAEAFAAYTASNDQLRAMNAARFEQPGQESALQRVEKLIQWFEASSEGAWREQPEARPRASNPKEHVFLVGFPRSGTTLLENVLAAHPDVESLEERDCLAKAAETYLSSRDGLERLSRISSGDAARERDHYWTMVRGFGVEPRGKVFIDKMPLASILLPLVSKLFPNARILFARRDPRDVVLSCFRRRFGMNASMYQLLTLQGAVAFYDAVMRLSEMYRERLPLPQHVVRYEDLVADFEGTARSACDFLHLDWSEDMADFAAKARTRGIATPSAAQVARGLNRDGQGVWRRYEEQLLPVLPMLNPWVERFGYAPI